MTKVMGNIDIAVGKNPTFPVFSFLPCINEEHKLQRHRIDQGSMFPQNVTITCMHCGLCNQDVPFRDETGRTSTGMYNPPV